MASINWGGKNGVAKSYKKDRTRGINLLKHCDQEFRQDLNRQHKNRDINPELSYLNQNFTGMSLEESRAKWTKRVKELEEHMAAQKDSLGRKIPVRDNTVEMTSLEMAAPAGMTDEQARQLFQDFYDICVKKFGEKNIISANSHFDEIHEYQDSQTGELRMSRPHIHIQIIPEVDGKLCNREFSNIKNIKDLDHEVSDLCMKKYHVKFHTGEKLRAKFVEQLKQESAYVRDISEKNKELEIKTGSLLNYLGNIHINKDLDAREDFELGGDGTAVNKAIEKHSQAKIREKEDIIVGLNEQIKVLEQQIHELQRQLKEHNDRIAKIKRGIELSDDPDAVQSELDNIIKSLESRGAEDFEHNEDLSENSIVKEA